MIIKPVSDMLLLPDVFFSFSKDFIVEGTEEEIAPGTEILFLLQKNEAAGESLTQQDFYPIGIMARVEKEIDRENLQVHTLERVDVTNIETENGRIMEGMKRSGVSNPVMVLDEVDKLAKDYGGDPASALLEVLDPEQNGTFTDHYMNVPYDLSNVLFVCTANTTETIPEPLLNRMEVISFSGYTAVEKLQIARRHLVPRELASMGIAPERLTITDDALRRMIDEYTMEAGVRNLKLCRRTVLLPASR